MVSSAPPHLFLGEFFVEALQEEGFAVDLSEGLKNLELSIGLGFADVNVLGAMMILVHRDFAAGTGEADRAGFKDFANLIHVEGAGFFSGHLPEINAVV